MAWAAVETSGPLRWLLVLWVVFVLLIQSMSVAGWKPEADHG